MTTNCKQLRVTRFWVWDKLHASTTSLQLRQLSNFSTHCHTHVSHSNSTADLDKFKPGSDMYSQSMMRQRPNQAARSIRGQASRRPARVQARGILFVQASRDFRLSQMGAQTHYVTVAEPLPAHVEARGHGMFPVALGAIAFISSSVLFYKKSAW